MAKNKGKTLIKTCPFCGKRCYIELTNEQDGALFKWHNGTLIQEAFPELNAVEREFIKTGYCPECQENIFGNGKTDKVKEINNERDKDEVYGTYEEH